ncbi:MAG TPA: rod shape-determining protein MreC [Patescibacteria group bacterium]|nr:rod shape-determining protein MreC [Patescibacteria group bacterium]
MKKIQLAVLFIFLTLSLLILLNNNSWPFSALAAIAQNTFKVPKSIIYGMRSDDNELTGKGSPAEKLKKENLELTQKLLDYDRIKRDNDAFRSQFDTTETKSYTLSPVKVIGFTGSFFQPITLTIDHGSDLGMKTGMAVVEGNNLIGKLGKVTPVFSEVILTINPDFVTLAKASDTGAPGVAHGDQDFILLDRVSINDTINNNTFLLTAGDVGSSGIGIPPELVIGKIVSVNKSPSLPFQTAKIETTIDFSRLETVFVVEKF